MKLSKRKRELLAEQSKKKEQTATKRAAFWRSMQLYLGNEKDDPKNDESFGEMVSYFAKAYGVEGLVTSMKKHPSLPQLTREIFKEWLSFPDDEIRRNEIFKWIHSAELQEKELKYKLKCEFIKRHPYRRIDSLDRFATIIDVTNGETFPVVKLEDYNASHHPEIDFEEASA